MTKSLQIYKIAEKNSENQALNQFFEKDGHLNDSGITLYVEALLLKREDELPSQIRLHAEECAICQQEIFEFYQLMKGEDLSHLYPHPFLDKKPRQYFFSFTPILGKIAAIFLLTVIFSLAYLLINSRLSNKITHIQPPFENINIQVPYQHWEIAADEHKSFVLSNGTAISVPANIFVDKTGKPVEGKVQLVYREFHKAGDLIAGGIPVSYDSAGVNYRFETAGVFEIRAFQFGEPVYLTKGKQISVNMASDYIGDNFNHYYLDENKAITALQKNVLVNQAYADNKKPVWKFIEESKVIYGENIARKAAETQQKKLWEADSLSHSILQMQANLAKSSKSNQSEQNLDKETSKTDFFQLSLNVKENPVLIKYQDAIWEYAGENKEESPTRNNNWIFKEKWDKLEISPMKYRPLTLRGHKKAVKSAFYSPDNELIVTASEDKTAKLWSKDGQFLFTLRDHTQALNSAVFSPDGAFILTASDDKTAKIWNGTGDLIFTLKGHENAVKWAIYSPDGKYIFTCSADNILRIWTSEGRFLKKIKHLINRSLPQFSPDSRYILHIPSDSTAELRSIEGEAIKTLHGNFNSIAFSAKNDYILTTSASTRSGTAAIWSIEGKLLKNFSLNDQKAIFSPTGENILTFGGKTARLWSLYYKLFNTVLLYNMGGEERKGHKENILSTQYAKDGRYIVTASQDKTAKIWFGNGLLAHTLRGHGDKVNTAVFSSDGKNILTASDDHSAKIWFEMARNDIYELELVKESKNLKDENGNSLLVKGKDFYTSVKMLSKDEVEESVLQPQPEENPLNVLVEKYEKLLEEITVLEKQKKHNPFLALRSFQVGILGFYQCGRAYEIQNPLYCNSTFELVGTKNAKIQSVYHIIGEKGNIISRYDYEESANISFDPYRKNKLLLLLADDKVAIFRPEDFSKIDLEELRAEGDFVFQVNAIKVYSKKDLDKILN